MVPTQYKTLYGQLSYLNQYSVIDKAVPVETMMRAEPVPGLRLRDFQGVVFTYDFHPVSVSVNEGEKEVACVLLLDFITHLSF